MTLNTVADHENNQSPKFPEEFRRYGRRLEPARSIVGACARRE
jgi:hypothetical protein